MKPIPKPLFSFEDVWGRGVRFSPGGLVNLLVLYICLGLLPLLGYLAWDLFDGGIGVLIPSTFPGVVVDAILEEPAVRLIVPAIFGVPIWLATNRKRSDLTIAACLWVATLAWAVAHPILGQPWSKLIELLPASVFYAILWQRAYDDLLFRARRLRFLDSQLASRVGLLFLLPGVRLALLAMVAHVVTNVLAVILWESAASF